MRQLATIRKISDLLPIDGADLILTAVIDGWTVVVKKDEFTVGDLCIYCEIDSFLPDGNPMWQHLVEKHPRMFEEGRGHRLKTVRLRGQLSQGFAAPIPADLRIEWSHTFLNFEDARPLQEGDDVTEILGIKKYEAPVPTELSGQVKGNFPTFIPKTDQDRCQNMYRQIFVDNADARYEITMKLDGTSFTAYVRNDHNGVCGRNWELSVNEHNDGNSLIRMYLDSGLQTALREFGSNYAVQGELMGPGIQKNRESLKSHKLFIFDIYDINAGKYLAPLDRHRVLSKLYSLGLNKDMVEHVPVIGADVSLADLSISSISDLLKYAEGPSIVHPIREGDVFKRMDGGFSFKAISNLFLLKEKD